ncbi:hypothetical protein BJ912DRAFT_944240, partial [Pholiota molesta]
LHPPPHCRRGSVTAPDPFGVHTTVNLDPNRTSSSTLTIVRIQPATPAPVPPALNEPPASPTPSSGPAPAEPPSTRVSFAFSSFGSSGGPRPSSPSGSHPPSPSSSPRLRPSSPHLGASSFGGGKPRLTPDQLVDLARQATIPRPHITSPNEIPTPATFTPLPDDIFLPFIDRPTEVAALISSPPDTFAKLHSSPADQASKQAPVDLPRDPLVHHLTKIDRDIASDFIWTIAARKCIFSHSELIWERIKGALGVPPELDDRRAAKGHWSDWDDRLSDSPAASMYLAAAKREEEAHFRAQMDDRLQGLQDTTYNSAGEATIVPTPHEQSGIPTLEKSPEYISIEPLLATTSPPDGLGDIAEGAEEEEDITAASVEAATGTSSIASPGGDGLGLRISTSPLPPTGASTSSTSPLPLGASTSIDTPPVLSPISPLPPSINNGSTGAGSQTIPASGSHGSRSHSRASSFSSIGPFQRSESTGNLAASWTMMAASAAAAGGSQYAGSVFGSEAGDSSGNFARLAGGPTMRANNPATRGTSTRGSRNGGKTSASARSAASPGAGPNAGLSAAEKRLSWGAGSVSSASAV